MYIPFYDKLLQKIKEKEIKKAKYKLKRLKIDYINNLLIQECKEYDIQYRLLEKAKDKIVIILKGRKEEILIKYHKTDMVFIYDYNSFLDKLRKFNIKKGVYITTGLFECKIIKERSKIFSNVNINIEDYKKFLAKQLGMMGKSIELINNKTLEFKNYFPK